MLYSIEEGFGGSDWEMKAEEYLKKAAIFVDDIAGNKKKFAFSTRIVKHFDALEAVRLAREETEVRVRAEINIEQKLESFLDEIEKTIQRTPKGQKARNLNNEEMAIIKIETFDEIKKRFLGTHSVGTSGASGGKT